MTDQLQYPSNIDAEQAVLGALLMNNEAASRLPMLFQADMFFEPLHRALFEAFIAGRAAEKPMNPVTIRSFLSPEYQNVKVADLTVPQYLALLCREAVNLVNLPDFAAAVMEYALRRDSMVVGSDLHKAAQTAPDEKGFIDAIRDSRDRLTAIVAAVDEQNAPSQTWAEAIDASFVATTEAAAGREAIGVNCGIAELHGLIGPIQKTQLIIIGGDVKTGKSALAWQIFFNLAAEVPMSGWSGEMPRQQIIMREIARRSGISAKKQKHGNVSSLEMDAIVQAGAEMKRLKWLDIDCRQMTLEQFDERVNRMQGEHGVEHYVVDHIGKFAWNGRLDGLKDFEKANRATSTLKNICMRRGVAIIALTHINKNTGAAVASKNFADRLSFAKFSRPRYKDFLGNIDKDADHMIITHQTRPAITALEPEEGTPNYSLWEAAMEEATGKAEFILALSRENEFPRRAQVQWNGSTTSYGPDFASQWNEKGLF